jgi:eukaryotic-like serine/threonine-protein kinase
VSPNPELSEIVADFLREAQAGLNPSPAVWLARFPQHAAELTTFFADLGRFGSFPGLGSRTAMDETVDYRAPGDRTEQPQHLGEYELLGEIGRGAMGVVYRARPAGTNLVVALKRVEARGLDGAEAVRRFREEVENASGLRHPHIVPIYHVGEQNGRPFYTMALIGGGSLEQKLAHYQANPRAGVALVAKVARAVHYAHQRRLLHRDLKPGNILLDEAGEPQVADFGLATRLDPGGAAAGGPIAGSLPWMAPEAVRRDATLTTAVDLWALGIILYEMLTGRRPFGGKDRGALKHAILEGELVPPRAANPRVSRDLDAVCRRCLEKDPDRRYESAAALALDLERWLRDEPVRARKAGPLERVGKWGRRHPAMAGGLLFLAVLVVAGVVAAVTMADEQERRLRQEVCRGNEFAARHVASTVLAQLQHFGDAVEGAADSGRLKEACAAKDWPAVEAFLKARLMDAPPGPGAPPFATAFVLDPTGVIRAEWPQRHKVVGEDFHERDYFRGARARADRADGKRVHLSRVFTSKNDGLDKLAVSVPFRLSPNGPVWVLGATVPTDATLGVGGIHDQVRKAFSVLLAPREPDGAEYVVLVHPGYESREPSVPLPPGRLRPTEGGFAADDAYADPVAGRHPDYAGRWLAGFAPVPGTELVVVVQQPYDEAVAPYRAFFRRFLEWLAAAAVAGALLVAGLWLARSRRSGPG